MGKGLEIIKEIEKYWYAKKLSDRKGWREEKPKLQSKKRFRDIFIFLDDGEVKQYTLTLEEFKEYRIAKFKMLGLEK